MSASAPTKVGAGLLICCEGSCLLLRRSESSGNGGTWGLPGGNADAADAGDLLGTALREAREELGELPQGLQVLGQVLTRRGKNRQKHFTVFLASIPGSSRAGYAPKLNEEHTDWRWLDLAHAAALGVHPLLHAANTAAAAAEAAAAAAGHSDNGNGATAGQHHPHGHPHGHPHQQHGSAADAMAAELAAGAVAAAGPPPPDMALHPVVRILFGGAHTDTLAAMLPPSVGSPVKAGPAPSS